MGWPIPATMGVHASDMRRLLEATKAPVVRLPASTTAGDDRTARALEPYAVELPDLGHKAHVEDPAAIWGLVRSLL